MSIWGEDTYSEEDAQAYEDAMPGDFDDDDEEY